jgi:hypothetical protein
VPVISLPEPSSPHTRKPRLRKQTESEDSGTTAGATIIYPGKFNYRVLRVQNPVENRKIAAEVRRFARAHKLPVEKFLEATHYAMRHAMYSPGTFLNEKGELVLGKRVQKYVQTLADELERDMEPFPSAYNAHAWRQHAAKVLAGYLRIVLGYYYPRP